jgi:hypothetical protein
MTEAGEPSAEEKPGLREYALVTAALTAFVAALVVSVNRGSGQSVAGKALIAPMLGMFALTALVWLLMVLARNGAILRGMASVRYYADYRSSPPQEWIERPARTFNNLMQVPTLFYVVCVLGVVTGATDAAQVGLAWFYVGARVVHSIVYIGWNYVPARFGCWFASCVVLGTMWWRFAGMSGGM